MSEYCAESDVYTFIPPGVLANPGRLIAAVSVSTEVLTLEGHGFSAGDTIRFRADSGGSLPSPIVDGTAYYAAPLTSDTFTISTTPTGSPVNITTVGDNVIVVKALPFAQWIEESSAMLEQTLPAHVVPITGTVPVPVRMYTAVLVAMRALAHVGSSTALVQAQLDFFSKQADKWARGVPLRGAVVPVSGALAVTGDMSGSDPRGWVGRSGNRRIP